LRHRVANESHTHGVVSPAVVPASAFGTVHAASTGIVVVLVYVSCSMESVYNCGLE
jgi:hypothetical protein